MVTFYQSTRCHFAEYSRVRVLLAEFLGLTIINYTIVLSLKYWPYSDSTVVDRTKLILLELKSGGAQSTRIFCSGKVKLSLERSGQAPRV